MNLLQAQNICKQFGSKVIFDNAGFSINEGEHVGVIGPNGAGKTTLFKVLVGQLELDSGTLTKSKSLRVGYLEQESEWALDVTIEEYLTDNCITPIWELKQLGLDLGLTEMHFATPLRGLSGGYRMRAKLLYLIGQEPNLMLLDEPTNFLDLESVLALEAFLQNYKGAFLLISHDREFLRKTTEATLEVEAGDTTKYPGHIDDYFEQKDLLREQSLARFANVETKRKHLQDFIDRFGAKATKAKQAQSRAKQIDKLEKVDIKSLGVKASIKVHAPISTGKESLFIDNAELGYADKSILKNVSLRMNRGDHIGVVGFNGAGKSTLLKSLAGELPLLGGDLSYGYQVSLSYYSQHSSDQLLSEDTVIDALERTVHPDIKRQEILNMAGSLLFPGDDVKKKIKVLSGGEKSRVALGQILLKKSPLLLLDEPTNHLDFETVEALTEALRKYEGSLVVVSHDRLFIQRVSSKILEIKDGSVGVFPGTYEEYVWSLRHRGQRPAAVVESETKPVAKVSSAPKGNFKELSKTLGTKIKQLETQVERDTSSLQKFETERAELIAALNTAQGPETQSKAKRLAEVSVSIEALEEKLIDAMESCEKLKLELSSLRS